MRGAFESFPNQTGKTDATPEVITVRPVVLLGAELEEKNGGRFRMASAVQFLRIVGKLKKLKRTGWVNNKVLLPESVADHMYRMAMCAMLIDESRDMVDRNRCIKMAIVHDLAEALAGDITPHDGVSSAEKYKLEKDALDSILKMLGDDSSVDEIKSLWDEYEDGVSPEARIVKDFDKFEMILQADEYEADQDKDLSDFFKGCAGKFKTPLVISWVEELENQRAIRRSVAK